MNDALAVVDNKTRANKISNETILQLRKDGHTLQQIADMYGITWQSVQKRLGTITNWVSQIKGCEPFKKNRADVLASIQEQALSHITPEKLEACSAPQLITVAGIAYDKERLERGQSTQNIANLSLIVQGAYDDLQGNDAAGADLSDDSTVDVKPEG